MALTSIDVVGVGNAIVDVLANADDAFLEKFGIIKGGMTLIEEDQASTIYDAMASGVEVSGGSAANTIACLASLGGRGGFIGKVADDALGKIFAHDLKSLGVAFATAPLSDGPGTGRCLVNVTADAQRSMSTFLGAAGFVAPDDVEEDFVTSAAITYFEGYLFEQEGPRAAFVKACKMAREAGRKTALTLSDSGCVERNHAAFQSFISDHVDILFANEDEARALFGDVDLEAAARAACPLTAITKSEKGSVLVPRDGDSVPIDAVTPTSLVDTTGAGDSYAAGVLYGLARDESLEKAGKLGALAASEIISHFGARPQMSLKTLAEEHGLI
ncbi:MAG: adenosine kinase [Pseudomonadota bacterium]